MFRTLVYRLVFLAAAATLARAETTVSPEIRARLSARLPSYDPAIRIKAEAEKVAADNLDPEIVRLPTLTVQEHALRQMEEDSLYRRGAHDAELVKRELSAFDRYFLNRFTLPLFGISKEQRAREAYFERKNREFQEHVKDLARLISRTDPEGARALRAALTDNARTGQLPESTARPSNWGGKW